MKVFANLSRGATPVVVLSLLAACASGGPSRRPRTGPQAQTNATFPRGNPANDLGWTISSREQVDAWLHGFAMVMADTTHVPIFARDYRTNMLALERQQNISTSLQANAERLGARFAVEPTLINAQFVPLYFASFPDLMSAAKEFLGAEGDPRESTDPRIQNRIALFARYFPNASDREWLQLFLPSLQDEYDKFYHAYWTEQQSRLAPVITEVSNRWASTWYPALRTYLSNTQQGSGEIILSLPLAGEGRTASQSGITASAITFPSSAAEADDAFYVFVHEAVQQVTNVAIEQGAGFMQRGGSSYDLYGANAAVRGGAMLLQRVSPGSVAGYMNYYLRIANAAPQAGDPTAKFESEFPLPKAVLDATARELTSVLAPQ